MTESDKPLFEDCLDIIDNEIAKRRPKWTLTSITWMDFDDVSQIIRIHIHKKWEQYDPGKPIEPWINKIITHQIKNIVRNNFSNFARPCLKCSASLPDEGCELYEAQCVACPLFKVWTQRKKSAYDVKIPLSIEHHSHELNDQFSSSMTTISSILKLNAKLKETLKPVEWVVYDGLFIKGLSEIEVAKELGYKTNEKNRSPGYKQIKNLTKAIIIKAKKLINDGDVDIY
jgi:hypothetical protein|tara:strand:+ start:7846 stop:8532 length:687 start_codon:yes stop_codon:yes gene_type:complete